ncbi:MAG: transketolase C-terminal domain-containing protein, partial [Planctomycetaceae bacterium]
TTECVERQVAVVEPGKAEVYRWGTDGMLIAFGSLFPNCVAAANQLREAGLDVGVINARFAKPIDADTIFRALRECGFVITIEESTIVGGFGSAVLEAANEAGLETSHVKRLGIPDEFVTFGERGELLADLSLDTEGICRIATELAARVAGPTETADL